MKHLVRHCLRVQTLSCLADFYGSLLGMQCTETGRAVSFGYSPAECLLEFLPLATQPYQENSNDQYWKIGVTLRNLDVAVAHLKRQGVEVTEPRQFSDIGYMCHIRDPNGFVIELLQQGFEGNDQPVPQGHPIGAQATLAHITLRVSDIQAASYYFEQTLAMRLMSVQAVDDYGFCLYFYAWSKETLPDADLASVKNREWLWARPYTLIELQHLQSPDAIISKTDPQKSGFESFCFEEQEAGEQSRRCVHYSDIPG